MISHTRTNLSNQIFIKNLYHGLKIGRTALPVNPALSIYAHFKHVVGIPSTDTQAQIPLNKLRLLDMLIDRLTDLQTKGYLTETNPIQQEITADNIEANISHLQQKLNRSLQVSKPIFTGQYNTEAGLLFNIYA